MAQIRAAITGVGGWVPETKLTNKDLEQMVDTTSEWIESRTGIKERRILKGEGLGTSTLGANAIRNLAEKTGLDLNTVDLVIVATVTPDYVFPSTANMITAMLGMKSTWGFDLAAACSGFLYAISTGAQFIESGRAKKVIVVGADKMSSIINYKDRTTCIIFGDGGGAVLLEPSKDENGLQDFILNSDGNGFTHLHMAAGGSVKPSSHSTIDAGEHYVYQEGQAVFKHAVVSMAEVSAQIMERNNLVGNDIAFLLPHQANKRICDATANRMGIGPEKMLMNIERYGNTTAATIPLLMHDFEKLFKKGDNIILAAFGGGFTWGSVYLKWAYDTK
jgi:3-oxoacyl-[acyl-carrier-protein] synthase-3